MVARWGIDGSNEQSNSQSWELKAVDTAHLLLEDHPQVLELVVLAASLKSPPPSLPPLPPQGLRSQLRRPLHGPEQGFRPGVLAPCEAEPGGAAP